MSNYHRVYIVNKSAHDFSEAEKYGQLIYITEGKLNRFSANDMHRQAEDVLKGSTMHDYIVPCSLNVLNSIVCATFAVKHGRLNLLLFKQGKYIERNIVFNPVN
jgi:hypothetical protein